MKTYQGGEELFALRITDYPELNKTRKELNLLDQLYGLYMDVVNTMDEYRNMCMTEHIERMEELTGKVTELGVRCAKLQRKLTDGEAHTPPRTATTYAPALTPLPPAPLSPPPLWLPLVCEGSANLTLELSRPCHMRKVVVTRGEKGRGEEKRREERN